MSWLLALHSSGDGLGVAVERLGLAGSRRSAAFPLGRALANALTDYVEQLLPAEDWPRLGRLLVATGPGAFTGTRLTVVLARTLAQQLGIPLHGVSSFLLVALRHDIREPSWVVHDLPRRGRVAGLYGPDPASPAGVVELAAPRLFAPGVALPAGPQLAGQVRLPADVETLLTIGAALERRQAAGPWQPVLPLYPTAPVPSA